jgi:5-methylcytosine-specific restriction endonuclease McrA
MKRTALRRRPRSRHRFSAPGARAWAYAARISRCAVCNRQAHHGHHIIYKQHLVPRDDAAERVWDLRNMLPVCASCHARHHSAFCRIPREVLPPAALEFALEVGLDYLIEQDYA